MRSRDSGTISLRLRFADHVRLGPGKMSLLDAVRRTGSIAQAAREMNMSYRRALMLIDSVNAICDEPAVIIGNGDPESASSRLSELGLALLQAYEVALQESNESVQRHFAQLLPRLRDLP